MAKYNSQKKEEDLENVKEVVAEFEKRMNTEVKRQEKLEEKNFRRGELLGKYITKILYRQNDGKFENEYLKRLERNWEKWKGKEKMIQKDKTSSFRSRNLERRVMSDLQSLDPIF